MVYSYWLLSISLVSCVLTTALLSYSSYITYLRQRQAFEGDHEAAKHIVLPCYKPIIKGMMSINALFGLAIACTFASPTRKADRIVQYLGFCLLGVYSVTPLLLVQSSVSVTAFRNMFLTLGPWWLVGTILWTVGIEMLDGHVGIVSAFIAVASLPPFLLSTGILTKKVKSRVQLGSWSNRNAAELQLSYSLFYAVYMIARLANSHISIDLTFVTVTFVFNTMFPWLNHRTLLADTKFWRGLGRCNQGGIDVNESMRQSGVDVHRPTMELNFVTSSFQEAMAGARGLAVDFAYLQLERYLSQGATAKVYLGKYRKKVVAIKLNTPPEVDEEVIHTFMAESTMSAALKHPNIVQFVGICIRPPQIGMVFEFCEGGNLKTSLSKQPALWSSQRRLRACLDAANGVAFLHSNAIIHRDIKAENFLVGTKMVVKLSDFGESTYFRNKEATELSRMTILGTVAFMAPELIAGARYYTEAVDIYALGVTLWEVWTGKDPWDGLSTFDLYDHVNRGERPQLPEDAPVAFGELLQKCWAALPEDRPTGPEIVTALERIVQHNVSGVQEAHETHEASLPVPERASRAFLLEGIASRFSISLHGRRSSGRTADAPVPSPAVEPVAEMELGSSVASPFHLLESAPQAGPAVAVDGPEQV